MFNIIRARSTHSARLERWLGPEPVARISRAMCNDTAKWYGPKIAVAGVPGEVYVGRDGDFVGSCDAGLFASIYDRGRDLSRRLRARARIATDPRRRSILNAGFASLSDFISEGTKGKRQDLFWGANFTLAGAIGSWWSSYQNGNMPPSAGITTAAPGGRACDNTLTTGALGPQQNAASGDQLYFAGGQFYFHSSTALGYWPGAILLYDRLFDVAKTMNSTASETVTGVPTRYQSTTASDPDYIGGNFLFAESQSTLNNIAHNWTPVLYKDQDGNASTAPSWAGIGNLTTSFLDQPNAQWFVPLEAGDVGIKAITNMKLSAAVTSGTAALCIGHPIAWIPIPNTNLICESQGITSAFSFCRIFDGACLALLIEVGAAPANNSCLAQITLVSG